MFFFVLQREWLCLSCQTQRAVSGQLGEMPAPAMVSPQKQPPSPAPSSTPAPAAVDRKPLVEASDLTPPAPDTKVVPETLPTLDALISPHHDAPTPDSTLQETPQAKEHNEPIAAEPVFEHIIQPEQQAFISDSVAQVILPNPAVKQQQNSSEERANDHSHPETGPPAADQQSATVSEIPAVKQQESSYEKASEGHPHSETEPSNVEQQAQSAPVSEIPAVEPQQSNPENLAENLSPPVKSETQHILIYTGLDKTVPAEIETEPNPKITQSEAAAPLTVNEKVESTPENLLELTTNSVEPQPNLIQTTVSQEVPVQLDPKLDYLATNVKDDTITEAEVAMPSEERQIGEATLASQTPSTTVDLDFNVEQTEVTFEVGSVAPDVDNEITEEIKVEPEPMINNPVCSEGVPSSAVEVAVNVAPVDNVEVPKPDQTQQELNQETAKCIESESFSDNTYPVLASEEESPVNKVENNPIGKEVKPTPLDPDENTPHVAPVEGQTKVMEEATEEKNYENKVFEKIIIEGETAKQKIHDEKTTVDMETVKDTAEEKNIEENAVEKKPIEVRAVEKAGIENKSSNGKAFEEDGVQNNAAGEKVIEARADKRKAFEEEAIEQYIVEKANYQKPQNEKIDNAESSPAPSFTETETVCPVIEKKEPEPAREPAQTVAKEIPTEEIPIHKEQNTGPKYEPSSAENSIVETVLLPDKSEEKEKPMVAAGILAQRKEKQTPIDAILKGDMVSSSAVFSEAQVRDEACEKKLIHVENTNYCIAENQHEGERETLAPMGRDERPLEKVAEQTVKEKEEKLDKKVVQSQSVAANIQEVSSVSETSIFCDKYDNAECDIGKDTVSKQDEVLDAAFKNRDTFASVASVLEAEPAIPLSVVSEQVKGLKEKNTNMEEKKEIVAQPLEKPCEEDAVSEMTIVFSISSCRLQDTLT